MMIHDISVVGWIQCSPCRINPRNLLVELHARTHVHYVWLLTLSHTPMPDCSDQPLQCHLQLPACEWCVVSRHLHVASGCLCRSGGLFRPRSFQPRQCCHHSKANHCISHAYWGSDSKHLQLFYNCNHACSFKSHSNWRGARHRAGNGHRK